MSIPYRTVSVVVSFTFHGMIVSGCIQASRTMLTGTLCKPYPKALQLTQIPLICCQASKYGLLNDDSTGLSDFGQRVAKQALLDSLSRKYKNLAQRDSLKASSDEGARS